MNTIINDKQHFEDKKPDNIILDMFFSRYRSLYIDLKNLLHAYTRIVNWLGCEMYATKQTTVR